MARDGIVILAITGVLLILLEVLVRLFTNVQSIGIDKALFAANRFGESYGNAASVRTTAFGENVYTDARGFRVPGPAYRHPDNPSRRVLFIGDSVTFGVGVREEQSFVGLLRKAHPDWLIDNASAPGYSPIDYLNAGKWALGRSERYDDIAIVVCLNDVIYETNQKIQESLSPKSWNILFVLKSFSSLQSLNDFIKDRSMSYVLIKNAILDTSREHFRHTYEAYQKDISEKLLPLADVVRALRGAGSKVTVFVAPYEYQLRHPGMSNTTAFLPQERILRFLKAQDVEALDLTPALAHGGGGTSRELFVAFDAMHFSTLGHDRAFQYVDRVLSRPAAQP